MSARPKGMMHVAALHHEDHKPRHDLFQSYHRPDQEKRIQAKIEDKEMLAPIESAYALQEGNKGHVSRVFRSGSPVAERIRTLLLVCADARMGGMFDFDDFATRGIAVVYVAGNVSGILASPGVKDVFRRMDADSSVVIVGHAKCGAVHCAAERHNYRQHRNISSLLRLVRPEGELENLQAQAQALRDSAIFRSVAGKARIRVLTAFVDISKKEPSICVIGGDAPADADRELIERMEKRFMDRNRKQDLSQQQFAHAVVISGPSLPYDPREIFSADANEIFCVSAGDFGGHAHKGALTGPEIGSLEMAAIGLLDQSAVASAEYSVAKNDTRHILLLHSDLAVIDAWEEELLKKSRMISGALIAGDLEITSAIYDSQTGRVTMVRHLVNEDAARAMDREL